jgi:hypothetical protein
MNGEDLNLTIRLGNRVVPFEGVPADLSAFLAVRRAQLRAMFGTASIRERIDERLYKKAFDNAVKDGILTSRRRKRR